MSFESVRIGYSAIPVVLRIASAATIFTYSRPSWAGIPQSTDPDISDVIGRNGHPDQSHD